MAYENGYEAIEYIGNCIEKYKQDNMIFSKASQLLSIYMARPDWPYCIQEYDNAMIQLLGQPVTSLLFDFCSRYLDDERIIWPDNSSSFRSELKSFYLAVKPLVYQGLVARKYPRKFHGLVRSGKKNDNDIIRFIRMDGQTLEMEMDIRDIEHMIGFLKDIVEKRSDQSDNE